MAQSFDSITPVLTKLYIPGVEPYTWSEDFVTTMLEKRERVEQVGYEFNVKVQSGFSEGVKNLASAVAALPDARQNQYKNYNGTVKTIAGRIKLFNTLMDYIDSDPNRVLDAAGDEIIGVREVLKCENERQVIGDAGATHLCTVASAAVTNETDTWVTVVVNNDAAALCGPTYPTRYLRNGMIIDILAANHASVSTTDTESLEIGDVVDDVTFTIKCATNAAADTLAALLADGQLIYHEDGYNNEFYGLKSLFGSTTNTIFDVDRTTTPNAYLKPRVTYVDSSGRLITGAPTGTNTDAWSCVNVHQMISYLVNTNHASKKDLAIVCEEGVKAAYIQKKKAENGYFIEGKKIDGWDYEVIEAEGVTLSDAKYMVSNAMCFVPLNKLKKYLNRKVDFRYTRDNSIWAPVSGYDAQEAYMIGTHQFGCENFKHGGWMGDLKGQYDQ